MNLLNLLNAHLETRRREAETYSELAGLSDRSLADLGIARADIGDLARAAARNERVQLPSRAASAAAPLELATPALLARGLGLRSV